MVEQGTSSTLIRFLHREVGLTPAAVRFDRRGEVLTIRLTHALTPMARIIALEDAGVEVVQSVYEALLMDCRERFEQLATEMIGIPVRYSRIAVDRPTQDVTVEFLLQTKEA